MECSITGASGRYTVAVSGEVDLMTSDDLRVTIRAVAGESEGGRIVVDLRHTTFCDVAGANALVAACNEVEAAGGSVVVEGARPEVQTLFRLLQVDGLLSGTASGLR